MCRPHSTITPVYTRPISTRTPRTYYRRLPTGRFRAARARMMHNKRNKHTIITTSRMHSRLDIFGTRPISRSRPWGLYSPLRIILRIQEQMRGRSSSRRRTTSSFQAATARPTPYPALPKTIPLRTCRLLARTTQCTRYRWQILPMFTRLTLNQIWRFSKI